MFLIFSSWKKPWQIQKQIKVKKEFGLFFLKPMCVALLFLWRLMGSEEPRRWELGGGGSAPGRQLAQSCAVKVTITAEQRCGSQHSRPRDPRAAQTAGPWFWFHYQFGRRDYKRQIVATLFFLPLFVFNPFALSPFFPVPLSAVLYRPSWQRTEENISRFLPLFHE